jgi:tight adherence protein C
MTLAPSTLVILSLALLAVALLVMAAGLLAGDLRRVRHSDLIRRALKRSAAALKDIPAPNSPAPETTETEEVAGQKFVLPLHWLNTRLGRALVGAEDRRMIDQCGYRSLPAQWVLLVSRLVLAIGLPLFAYFYWSTSAPNDRIALMAGGLLIGFMGPKWLLRRKAAACREQVVHELPLFVDLLRLLQGVGLSLDQSLQIMAAEFRHVLPVLGRELDQANRQYTQGRTREQSLHRLATLHENENLTGLVSLLVQVDRHGGAVQEPLRTFSDRLREHRRSEMKERIGRITVKMTGIMVTTLLPALVLITAGPGVIAVIRSLGNFGR